MNENKWLDLQLFADGGEGGGEGAATGVEAADPGQQRLRELGVPASKITRRASEAVAKVSAKQAPTQQPTQQVAAATEPTEEEPKTDAPARKSFQELMKDPEYNKEMQAVVQSRLRTAKGAEENLQKLAPALEVLARKHNMDPANLDYAALAEAVSSDTGYYEDMAFNMGVPVETAMKMDRQERDTARQQRQEALNLEQQRFQEHISSLERQAEAMKQVFPNFDLKAEMQNPTFRRMTAPSGGVSVEDAYYAIHRKELQTAAMQATAHATARKISASIQANGRRPQENGTSGQAPSVTTFDYRSASPEQREQIKKFLRSEAAQGRKVSPNMYRG